MLIYTSAMQASFHIETSFIIASRSIIVFIGDIRQGSVAKGMTIVVPLDRDRSRQLLVDAVEFVDPGGKIGLCVKYADREDLDTIQKLKLERELVEIAH
jgi:hypothetical protein